MQAEVLLTALADKSRLKIIASLSERPKFVEELSLELNIGVSTVSFHLKKLLAAKLVVAKKEQYYQTYSVVDGVMSKDLAKTLRSLTPEKDAFKESVKGECFVDGRVKSLPVQIRKREVIYSVISEKFTPNKLYGEGAASALIATVCDDVKTAKEEMLELGFLIKQGDKILKKSKKSAKSR